MAQVGEFRVDTSINDKGVTDGASRIQNAMSRLVNATKKVADINNEAFGPKQQKQLDQLNQKLVRQQETAKKAARDVEDIARQYEALSGTDASPASLRRQEADLKKIQKEIQAVEKEYSSLENQLLKVQEQADFERLASGAISPQNAAEIERLVGELDVAGLKLGELDDKSQRLQSSIEQIKLNPGQSDEAQKLANKLQSAEEKATRLANEAGRTAEQIRQIATAEGGAESSMNRFAASAKEAGSALLKVVTIPAAIAKGINKAIGSVKKLTGGFQKTQKSANGLLGTVENLRKRILKLAAAAVVFNVIRRAFTQLRNYMWAVIQTNQEFISSLASVKGNLLTAFQPIYEAILPALNALGAALARVTAYIAAFVNLLFGKSIKGSQDAAKGLYDQAKALGAVGGAADKAAGSLAAFDEINVLSQQDAGGGGGGGSDAIYPDFDYDFSFWDEWADKAQRFLDVFRDAWANVGDYVISGWNHALQSTIELAKKIGATFYEVWTDGHGQDLIEAWLTLLGTMLHIIGDIADAFSAAWDSHGYKVVASIFEALTSVLKLLNSIGVAFREAWDDYGISIAENLLQIFSDIMYTISEIAQRLQEAWESNGNGVKIWGEILGLIDDILATIRQMSSATLQWAKELDLTPAVSSFTNLLAAMRKLANFILGGLQNAYISVLLPFGKWLLELAVPAALDVLSSAFDAITNALEALAPIATSIWENFFLPLGEWTAAALLDALGYLQEKLDRLSEWFVENNAAFLRLSDIVGVVAQKVWTLIEPLANKVWESFKAILDRIIEAFLTIFQRVVIFTASTLELIDTILDLMDELGILELIIDYVGLAWERLENIVSIAIDVIVTLIDGWLERLTYFLQFFTSVFTGDIKGAIDALEGAFKTWANSILSIFDTVANGIVTAFESAINFIIKAINTAIDAANSLTKFGPKIPNVPSVTLDRVPVPRLATGAVIPPNAPFYAELGDQTHGRNLEAPEGLIRDIVRQETGDMISELLEGLQGSMGGQQSITIELDGSVLYKGIVNAAKNQGSSMIKGNSFALV